MQQYQKEFAKVLADNNVLFFDEGLKLKDGRPTPYFVNIGVFGEKASLTAIMGKYYAAMLKEQIAKGMKTELIFGPSYKGSLIAIAAALSLHQDYGIDAGVIYDRKEAKTHGEASKAKDMLVGAKLFDKCNIFMVDDVISSGGTKFEAVDKLNDAAKGESISINIAGLGIAVDRQQTTALYENPDDINTVKIGVKGSNAIKEFTDATNIPVFSVVGIKDVINFLYENKIPVLINRQKQPMPAEIKKKFDDYMGVYGV